jgi:Holliday junction resolvase
LIDFKKVNRLRRSRGYSFEYNLVNAFNTADGWAARRLGGSSSGLPDLVVTNKDRSILYSIECKSGEANILTIPADQILRCLDITNNFLTAYKNRYIVFAFKFKGTAKRKLQYRFVIVKNTITINSVGGFAFYNLAKDDFVMPSNEADTKTLYSINEFVNFL